MHFTCFNQKYSEFNCGHLGIKLKSLGAFWKKFVFVKLGNGVAKTGSGHRKKKLTLFSDRR